MVNFNARASVSLQTILVLSLLPLFARASDPVTAAEPPQLAFSDLMMFAGDDPLPPDVQAKLDRVLDTPTVRNRPAGSVKAVPAGSSGGIRIAEWNINKGVNQAEIVKAFADPEGFASAFDRSRGNRKGILDEARELNAADIIVFDEVDDGNKRTGYRNVAGDIAEAMRMNYAFGTEFIELDRIYLGVRNLDVAEQPSRRAAGEIFDLDPKRYRGLEGTAVLSRYPILSARIVRLPAKYDWYHSEVNAISQLEQARRWTAERLFEERIRRQVRRGNRIALIVRLSVPDSPTGAITVVAPHLEDYTNPRGRREQMNYLLKEIRDIRDPVVMAGDLNSFNQNGTPLTIKRALLRYLGDYHFWLRQVAYAFIPVPGLSYMLYPVNYFKNWRDPSALNIPIFLANPSGTMFDDIQKFRFTDGGSFDFEGNPPYSYHHRGRLLSNSSQRAWKGFQPTFSFQRTWHGLIGVYKIDWIFVKPWRDAPGGVASDALAPYDGRTFHHLNTAPPQRISDHSPMAVKLGSVRQISHADEVAQSGLRESR